MNLHRKAEQLGMTFPKWPDVVKFGRSKEDVPVLFKEILDEYRRNGATCELIFVVMGGKSSDIYGKLRMSLITALTRLFLSLCRTTDVLKP